MPVERVFLIYWALLSGEETGLWSTGHGYGCGVYLRGVAHGVLLEYLFLFLSLVSFLNNVFKHRRWVLFFGNWSFCSFVSWGILLFYV